MSQSLTVWGKKAFEKIGGKGETAGNQHFLFSSIVFFSLEDLFPQSSLVLFVVCTCLEFGNIEFCYFEARANISQYNKLIKVHVLSLLFFLIDATDGLF